MSLFSPSPILNLRTDPHFQSFSGRFFSFHGQCDLLLMRSKMFAGTGVAVHIRTTRVDNTRAGIMSYSYISGVAVQVGKDTLEVTDGATLLINGSEETFLQAKQILDTEPMLFQEVRDPQFPHGCLYESSASSASKLRGSRRLMDVGTEVTLEAAEAACAKSTGDLKQFCIDDVVAMGDVQVAEDPFYG